MRCARLRDGNKTLIDSREPRRYAGAEEPLDAKAGHIPGAVNYFWKGVLEDSGHWKDTGALREHFTDIPEDAEIIVYCGSGVTACPNVLALEEAGYGNVKLYAGAGAIGSAMKRIRWLQGRGLSVRFICILRRKRPRSLRAFSVRLILKRLPQGIDFPKVGRFCLCFVFFAVQLLHMHMPGPQSLIVWSTGFMSCPYSVIEYSTFGGICAYTSRCTIS